MLTIDSFPFHLIAQVPLSPCLFFKTKTLIQSGFLVDGEAFTIKRGYKMRPSTLRKLHEIRANHKDVNVYMNTIIDEAINFYYNYFFNNK